MSSYREIRHESDALWDKIAATIESRYAYCMLLTSEVAFHPHNGDMVPVLCQVQHWRVWCTACLIFLILQNLHQLRLFPAILYFPYNLYQGWLVQNLALLVNLRKYNYTWNSFPNSRTGINGLSCLIETSYWESERLGPKSTLYYPSPILYDFLSVSLKSNSYSKTHILI